MIGGVLPRAIAWVSTSSVAGVGTIAPVSFFTAVGGFPTSCRSACDRAPMGPRSRTQSSTSATPVSSWSTSPRSGTQTPCTAQRSSSEPTSTSLTHWGWKRVSARSFRRRVSSVRRSPSTAWLTASSRCPPPDHVAWGRVKPIRVRDDLYLPRGRNRCRRAGRVRQARGRIPARHNIFTTPLPDELVDDLRAQRARRLDDRSTDYSPIDKPPNGHLRAQRRRQPMSHTPVFVLVNRAFAHASGFGGVIRELPARRAYRGCAANSLRSIAFDAGSPLSVRDCDQGPVVLAGHSTAAPSSRRPPAAWTTSRGGLSRRLQGQQGVRAAPPSNNRSVHRFWPVPPTPATTTRPWHRTNPLHRQKPVPRNLLRRLIARRCRGHFRQLAAAAAGRATKTATVAGWKSTPSWCSVSEHDNALYPTPSGS